MTDTGIASIVRSLAEGVDPGRVLRDVAHEALSRTATSHLLLAAMLEGQLTPLVAIGSPHPVLFEVSRDAFSTGRAAHRSDPALGLAAMAVPVRSRGAVVAVLAVAGGTGARGLALEPHALALPADCAALALAARPVASVLTGAGESYGGAALAGSLATIAAAGPLDQVVAAALDVAGARFAARAGFVCLPTGPDGVEVVGWRGVDRYRLGAASRHPGFTRLVSGAAVTVIPPTDPTVAQLTAGAEFAVCLPLVEDGPGALVLLVAEEPDAAGRRALDALRAQVAAGLRAARSAAAVEAAGTQLATLLNTLADPVLVVDPAGRFAALNPAAAELFALSDSFELGRPARGRLGHPGLEALLLGTEPSPGAGAPAEVVLGRPTPRRYQPVARALGGAGGRVLVLRPTGAAPGAGRDDLDVVAALGRALRDPLAAITALTTAGPGGDGFTLPSDWDVARKGIAAEAARLEALADQLALLSADGQGAASVAFRPERLDLVAAIEMVVGAHRVANPERDLAVAGPARLDVVTDRRLLERVIDPLIDNALRYSDGPVTVEVADRGETFEVAVVDVGPGIFSGDIPGLFERFHPLDGSPARRGAGLGLYTGRRLAELMGGRLWCDSRLGLGSRFALRLPLSPATR